MRIAAPLALLVAAACAPHRPTVAVSPVEDPRDIASSSWERTGATSIAHREVRVDGIVVAWVKIEPPVRRTATNGEPNFAPVQRQQFAWLEADCQGNRLRQSRWSEYADGAIVRTSPSNRVVGWKAVAGGNEYLFRLVCDGAGDRSAPMAAL